jgi:arabinose-5-phosphate isomerase
VKTVLERIQEVITHEANAMASVRVTPEFEHAVFALRDVRGKILSTGIGKAGLIARKFAATLCSTGTPAIFLHPAEAAHGDLGLVDKAIAWWHSQRVASPSRSSRR